MKAKRIRTILFIVGSAPLFVACASQSDLIKMQNRQDEIRFSHIRKSNIENNYFKLLEKRMGLQAHTKQLAISNQTQHRIKLVSKSTPKDSKDLPKQDKLPDVTPIAVPIEEDIYDILDKKECDKICKYNSADCEMQCPATHSKIYENISEETEIEKVPKPKDKPLNEPEQTPKEVVYVQDFGAEGQTIINNFGDNNSIAGKTSGVTTIGQSAFNDPLMGIGASIAKEYSKDSPVPIMTAGDKLLNFTGKAIKPIADTVKVLGVANIAGDIVETALQEAGHETNTSVQGNQIGNASSTDGVSGSFYDDSIKNETEGVKAVE